MSSIIPKKTRVSLILPEALYKEMSKKMKATQYGAREVSLWVGEALERLLTTTDFPELVKIEDSMSQVKKKLPITAEDSSDAFVKKTLLISLEDEAYLRLNRAVIAVREQFPAMDGVKSRILRTAIIQRLLRE